MKMIWFCHNPINGKSCGMCRPCQQKMECGMDLLLDNASKKRYRAYKSTKKIFGDRLAGKMTRILRKL